MPSSSSKTKGAEQVPAQVDPAKPGSGRQVAPPEIAPRPMPESVVVGRVAGVRGLKGDLLVAVLSDVPGRLRRGVRLTLVEAGGARREVEIVAHSANERGAVLRLAGVADRDAALALRGATFEIPRPVDESRPEGAFFEYELIGCECSDRTAGELGVLDEVVESGGGQLLRIVGSRGVLLVPFVESFVERVDIAARRVELALPEGLVETCVSRS